ncbi:hypothetical protein AVEN_180368-1 [Araneus ventricosus]|uniref:Uncharacterized protein n=2 Tax=Araneus ventricosus TaxID=182803 RepID=A0A4Y2UTU9_ARAVE|nr:hypothetical protein AVEN_180368-1 [Araneus ventricosus]
MFKEPFVIVRPIRAVGYEFKSLAEQRNFQKVVHVQHLRAYYKRNMPKLKAQRKRMRRQWKYRSTQTFLAPKTVTKDRDDMACVETVDHPEDTNNVFDKFPFYFALLFR